MKNLFNKIPKWIPAWIIILAGFYFVYYSLMSDAKIGWNSKVYHTISPLIYWCEAASLNKNEVDAGKESSQEAWDNFVGRRFASYKQLDTLPEGTLDCLASHEYRVNLIDEYKDKSIRLSFDIANEYVWQSETTLEVYENMTRTRFVEIKDRDLSFAKWLPKIDIIEEYLNE